MDIVLELLDRYALDWVYATVLPLETTSQTWFGAKHLAANATYSSAREGPTAVKKYHYKPASEYIQFEPTQWAYQSSLARDDLLRQFISLYFITWIFGLIVYFLCSTLSYIFVFDKTTQKHPKYLKNQIALEMKQANVSMPIMAIFTAPIFLLEVRGFSKSYDTTADGPGLWYNFLQFPFFLLFTDFFIYWIHRGLHHKRIYKHLHKAHHKWIMPTPFASHAFHPLDGFAQSVPYHVFPFLFPLQKFAYVALFAFVNIWTVMIHDGEYVADSPIINGAACHTMHHLYFNFNYGQYTTLWDRLGGSYRKPNDELFKRELKMGKKEWERQTKEMEALQKEVEGDDDRTYGVDESKKVK